MAIPSNVLLSSYTVWLNVLYEYKIVSPTIMDGCWTQWGIGISIFSFDG